MTVKELVSKCTNQNLDHADITIYNSVDPTQWNCYKYASEILLNTTVEKYEIHFDDNYNIYLDIYV